MGDIPKIGLGTWALRGAKGQRAIEEALKLGYRHLDTADYYKNHDIVAAAIKKSELPREEIFIVTKIMPPFSSQKILSAGPRFLEELKTDYLDLLLVHWPDSNPVEEVLVSFQKLKDKGVTKKIGVSNFNLTQVKKAVSGGFPIYNHQFEIYPGNLDHKLLDYCLNKGITVTAYSPFAQGRVLNHSKIKELSDEASISPAQLILAWLMQKGIVVIPKASSRDHLQENFQADKVILPRDIIKKLDNF